MQVRPISFLSLALMGVLGCGARSPLMTVAQAAPTDVLMLSGTDKDHTVPWDFYCTSGRNSGAWTSIPVPSNWETKGFGSYTNGWNLVPEERGLYKTSFTPPASWSAKKTWIVFEGSMTDTEVKINGQLAGPVHQGGFYRFKYEVSDLIKAGQPNLLEVSVSKDSADASVNRAERQSDYWIFGGIFRPVYLEANPAQYIERAAINATADGQIAVEAHLGGIASADTLTAQVKQLNGKSVGAPFSVAVAPGATLATLATRIAAPALWTAETPNLYTVEVKLSRGGQEIHRVSQRFGFRTIEVRAGDGIYVNGRRVVLKGAARHSFWPDSGRTTSLQVSRADVMTIKAMNMNAVRMSHYPPDPHFLDVCDELGLYVLDELGGWQKKYDTAVGRKLVAETVIRDVNHPSILFWDNGNEGGWNTDLDADYALYDPQKRPVLHPWGLFSGVQTDHYENYESTRAYAAGEKGNNVFMPTEFLHGLYDGGAGAGLDDYWKVMTAGRLNAGGFIWALLDEGLVRDDQNGRIDVAGNNYPDGILGPYRQKEASFYTIRDIWSPIQLVDADAMQKSFPAAFGGQISIANSYSFLDTKACRFTWELANFNSPALAQSGHQIVAQGAAISPSIAPGARGILSLRLPANWKQADALLVRVNDPDGRQVAAWNWTIKGAADFKNRLVPATSQTAATATQDAAGITLMANGTQVVISKTSGRLLSVTHGGAPISLSNGPTLASGDATFAGITLTQSGEDQVVEATYTGNLNSVRWIMHGSGWLELNYKYNLNGSYPFLGVNFDYPEAKVQGVKWLGKGPYRVWKNRMRGPNFDVWSKDFNDTATGADTWKYPEFKGYHADTMWAQLSTTEGKITVVSAQDNLFLRLFTPRNGPDPRTSAAAFPAGNISFLDGVAPIGTKFDAAELLGPQSLPNQVKSDFSRSLFFFFGELPTSGR